MRVQLIACTGVCGTVPGYVEHQGTPEEGWPMEADELVEQADRLRRSCWERNDKATATNQGFVADVVRQSRNWALEHASATFYIDGVTWRLSHALMGYGPSVTEVSPRLVDAKMLVTASHRVWREVLWDALSPAADAEFRQSALLILAELKTIAPNIYADFTDDGWVTG